MHGHRADLRLSLALATLASGRNTSDESEPTERATLDAERFDLQVRLFAPEHDLEGLARVRVANISATALDVLRFYLHPELRLVSVCDPAGRTLDYETELFSTYWSATRSLTEIRVRHPLGPRASTTLEFRYQGWLNPSAIRAVHGGGLSDSFYGLRPEVVFFRSLAYTLWFPLPQCGLEGFNDLASYRLELDIPSRLRPLAFGSLLSETVEEGRNRSAWETYRPVSLVDPCLFLDQWVDVGSEGFRLYCHDDAQSKQAAAVFAPVGEALLAFFRRHYAAGLVTPDAPFILAELNLPMGAFAGQNNVGLSQDAFVAILTADRDGRYGRFQWLGHEMVQEHVATLVDTTAKGQAIICDGFALYFHLPCLWELFGTEFEQWDLQRRWNRYEEGLDTGRNAYGPVPPHVPLADITLLTYPPYKDVWLTSDKLQIILHRLQRHIVGDAAFLKAFSEYLREHREKPATLDAFRAALEKESGLDLREFFHRWFHTTERLPPEWKPLAFGPGNDG